MVGVDCGNGGRVPADQLPPVRAGAHTGDITNTAAVTARTEIDSS
ncbi:hypothetical protein B005_2305 [Nocardiopsis alba ATCC BAA-2165]|uniref:Uncharacterized protein n=1 Tax=Nocardiopsis alba (strain ATCC BAA-2165 / BE74) TaxID=1205910 RepID=J7L9T1_NOCAA|nr:hypothetical protein B005_2305 [Nocardiopsis alba ATCC BAA-2165]